MIITLEISETASTEQNLVTVTMGWEMWFQATEVRLEGTMEVEVDLVVIEIIEMVMEVGEDGGGDGVVRV